MTDERSPTTLGKIRRFLLGHRSAESDTTISSLANAARLSPGNLAADPGPFDEPPSEPVTLEGEIPWELREEDPPPAK